MTRKKWLIGCCAVAALLVAALVVVYFAAWRYALGPEGQYFDSDGVRIHYTDEGQGTPVVLVHGLAFMANLEWRRPGLVDALSGQHRVITLDNRGHGRSDKPHDPAAYGANMVEDIVRLLDHLHIEKAHVIGLSMGGFITLKMEAMYPERILSAAPCAAGWEPLTDANLAFAEAVAGALERKEGIGPLADRLGLTGGLQKFGVRLGVRFFNDPKALAAVLRGFPGFAVTEEALRANTVPTLTIIGSEDGFLPDAQALAAIMANHELLVVDGKTHMDIAHADEFREGLLAFLARNTAGESMGTKP